MSDSDRFFVATNVLLYSLDTSAPKKQEAALLWLRVMGQPGQRPQLASAA